MTYNPSAAGGSGAMTLIEDTTLGSDVASVTFSSIPGTYKHLLLLWQAASDQAAAQSLFLRFNGDTGANYDWELAGAAGGTAALAESLAQAQIRIGSLSGTSNASSAATGRVDIPNYASASWHQQLTAQATYRSAASFGDMVASSWGGYWRNTATVTSITAIVTTGNIKTTSRFTLYGIS